MRIFIKKGKPTFEEKKMKLAVEKALKEKGISESQIQPASTFQELKALYNRHVPEDAVIESESKSKQPNLWEEKEESSYSKDVSEDTEDFKKQDSKEDDKESDLDLDKKEFIDPFNRAEKKVRDYVLENEFSPNQEPQQSSQEPIAEPTSFHDAFGIPDPSKSNEESKGTFGSSPSSAGSEKKKEEKTPPINPAWEEMSNSKKNKSTKQMAKWLVEIFCAFAEKGLILFGTKDINNTKLAEYASTQEIELGLILDDIGGGVQGSVRTFFERTCAQIEEVAQFSIEEKAEISSALYEVLLEKGIAPNASQNLAIVLIGTVGVKVFSVYMLVKPVNSIIEQLREMRKAQLQEQIIEDEVPEVPTEEVKKPRRVKKKKSD
jgi:hypothetical protein